MMTAFHIVLHMLLQLAIPPLLLGVINRVKAIFAGRNGPPLLQPYYDLLRLFRKGLVFSTSTTWMFRVAPLVTVIAVAIAGLMVPVGPFNAPLHFPGDLILFAYLFALARFFTTAAALDTGSSFEGMGAAREVTFACLSEPALFLAFLVLARLSGSLNLSSMLLSPLSLSLAGLPVAPLVLVSMGLFIVLLAENCRIPIDDPNTHLELTMIHEVMVLDHSGPLLGIILYSASMKLFILSAVLLRVLLPFQTGFFAVDYAIFIMELLAVAATIGIVESTMARLQMRHVPTLLVSATVLCGFGFLLMLRLGGN